MNGHEIFCRQTKSISVSKALSMCKIERYGERKSHSHVNQSHFILQRCGLTTSPTIGLFFFEEMGPVTCTVNCERYESFLCNQVIPAFQQRACLDRINFIPDDSPPQITRPVMQMLKKDFESHWTKSRHFPTACHSRSSVLNPCDFWLQVFLKHGVFSGLIANLAELKEQITLRI